MANTIITKYSITAGNVPDSSEVSIGELAVNVTDKKLYTKNNSGTVVEIASSTSALATGTADSTTFLRGDRTWSSVPTPQFLGTSAVKAISYYAQAIAESLTIPGNYNALSAGPITLNTGYTITIESGSTWTIV